MGKTLGQVAFERFWELSPFKDDAPSNWAGRGPISQAAWQAAADAVVNQYIVVRSTADRKLLDDKEQAVIKAARNLVHGWRWTTDSGEEITVPPWDYYSQDLLTEKLRALDSEEG